MQEVRVGAAVKIVRSEKRANNFGHRKRALVGSNPVISTIIGNPLMKIGGFLILYYSFFIIQYSSFIKQDFRNEQ